VQESAEGAELVTKTDLTELRAEFKADIADLRNELRQTELRLEAKIEPIRSDMATMKSDILNRVFGLILRALLVNIVAIIGAMFGLAKLLGH
jgi:hypothetical protein